MFLGSSRPVLLTTLLVAMTDTAFAHHSMAMFDRSTTVALQGTVRQYQWTNPHCFVQLLVATPEGPREWSIEMNSPAASYREGWRPSSFRPGASVNLIINPVRDGSTGGRLVSAADSDGRDLNVHRVAP